MGKKIQGLRLKILIVGSGAREYSIALSLLNDTRLSQLYFCPGNGATSELGENIDIKGNEKIVAFCINNNISLVIIGPEEPLISGLSDQLRENNIRVFGPSKKAARLEGSKIFMKNILDKYHINTAKFFSGNDKNKLCDFINTLDSYKIVIKADGLCAGKGVIITDKNNAEKVLDEMLNGNLFGDSGKNVIIEEYLDGFELSIFAICDGDDFIILPSAQDHKKLLDNDLGPNTGGMGAYSPTPLCNEELLDNIKQNIIKPTLDAMKNEGFEFCGVLFCGIMVVDNKPYVLEFNVRFGDPECEVILPLLKTPLLDILNASIDKKIKDFKYEIFNKSCVGVVVASKNYPFQSSPKEEIEYSKINFLSNQISHISFAGVSNINGRLFADGGRVFVAVGIGENLLEAKQNAYKLIENIRFMGMQFRNDIAFRALT